MQKSNFPNFHKKNIIKRQEDKNEIDLNLPESKIEKNESMDYPPNLLSTRFDDEEYPELGVAVELYNMCRYENALKIFEERPPDPTRFFKNMVCTFNGPIGWLLMFNTKAQKDAYIRFCKTNCLYRLERYSEALNVIKLNFDVRSIYLKAWCQYKLGYHKDAKESFKKAISLNPKYLNIKLPYPESEIL